MLTLTLLRRTCAPLAAVAGLSLLVSAPAHAQPTGPAADAAPSTAPATKDVEDPAVTTRAKDALHRVQTGALDRAQLADEYNQALSDDTLHQAQTELGALGEPSTFDFEGKAQRGNITAYVYRVKFAQGADIDEMIAFDDTNKIVRMIFSLRHPNGAAPAPSPSST